MPLQNRVTPFGEILAHPARGTLMGNRGCLHDAHRQLGTRRWAHQAWVICRLNFKHWHRTIMKPGVYTELFFTDEAVALAAGHRPCGMCRHDDYIAFQQAFGRARPELGERPSPVAMNRLLHADRVEPRSRKQLTHRSLFESLPDGVFFTLPDSDEALVRQRDRVFAWSFEGYQSRLIELSGEVCVLTPRIIVDVLRAGYRAAEIAPQLRAPVSAFMAARKPAST
ncbi:hypothetical protein [Maricaulis salignorans]|uniref:Metal binding domain of Ada n=1 Tax=Maricaulis salignorans TaxID=144026 RepID=A0A1G9WJK4_9PROT|nr:hypothetical protein [Maricaulis salignorans]SDM84629.1 hypothetical protein SAMN04488568_12533 [Maricaulis salignorans]